MVRAATFVDVRVTDDNNLSVLVPLFSGSRTLCRPRDEQLSRALSRLRAAAAPNKAKQSRSEKRAKRAPDSVAEPGAGAEGAVFVAVLDAAGVALDEEAVTNEQAWVSDNVLVLGDKRLSIRVNVPVVTQLRLAFDVPVVGYPLVPVPLGVQYCKDDELVWRWTRHAAGKPLASCTVATAQRYVPGVEDLGCVLIVTCTVPPPFGEDPAWASANGWTPHIVQAVTQRVLPAPQDRRDAIQRLTAAGTRSSDCVRFLSYNVLADSYSHTWGRLYPYLPMQYRAPGYRLPRALEDIMAADADVVALQEVDLKWFERYWKPQLEAVGYVGRHTSKNSTAGEGCALFVRQEAYTVASFTDIDLRLGLHGQQLPQAHDALAPLLTAQPGVLTALGKVNTIAQVAVLIPTAHGSSRPPLVVANTHLYFHPGATTVRVLQLDALLRAVAGVRADWEMQQRTEQNGPLSFVLCGDLNAEPHDAAVQYLTQGFLDATHPDWSTGAAFAFDQPIYSQSTAQPASAHTRSVDAPLPTYANDLPRDERGFGCASNAAAASLAHTFGPLANGCGQQGFTNYVGGFVAVLDYVLHDATLVSVRHAETPSLSAVTAQTALPSAQFPSDHLPQCCDLRLL